MKIRKYGKVFSYIGSEYIVSFFLAFAFFFFIFFVNQILVIAQRIALKKVEISQLLTLVVLSIPQFLMYTMPFSSLASASMVIGNLSSQNEILALRSNGIHTRQIFMPIVIISLFFSVGTLAIADKMIPYTSIKYKELYSDVLQNIPTIELESYSSTTFDDIVISNGAVEGNTIYDILLFDNSNRNESRVISAKKATITLLDLYKLLYRIDFEEPQILINGKNDSNKYSTSSASQMSLFVTLNSSGDSYFSLSPSQMSIAQLIELINEKYEEKEELNADYRLTVNSISENLGSDLIDLEKADEIDINKIKGILNSAANLKEYNDYEQYSFYYQYYKSELFKKFALAFACTALVFMAFPISFFKVRYGRLIGFGISMFVACIYWFFIYFMHTKAIVSTINPFYFLHLPNFVSIVVGLFLLIRLRKK